jgi:hypothetical protein
MAGRHKIPCPENVRCSRCNSTDLRPAGMRVYVDGSSYPRYTCRSCGYSFATGLPPERIKAQHTAEEKLRVQLSRGEITLTIRANAQILTRLEQDCRSRGLPTMAQYFQELAEVRYADLISKSRGVNVAEPEKLKVKSTAYYSATRKNATSVALATIRSKSEEGRGAYHRRPESCAGRSKSEACRVGQAHRTHRAAQEQ